MDSKLRDLLQCAVDDWEALNGKIIFTGDPHWTVAARELLRRKPVEAEAAGPKPVKGWACVIDGKIDPDEIRRETFVSYAGRTRQPVIRVEIRAIPPARKPTGKHTAARKGK